MKGLEQKLENVKHRFSEVSERMSDPSIMEDMNKYVELNKEYKELEDIVKHIKAYQNVLENLASSETIINTEEDKDFLEMAKQEYDTLLKEREKMEESIKMMLVPKDEDDDKNIIVEIRAGTGGDEAAIFVGDLFRMYTKYFEKKKWKVEIIGFNEAAMGGYKEINFNVEGTNVYGMLKYESGVHRVQRVPQTESQGRVHTSAVSVAVLPEAEEVDIDIRKDDIRKDTYRSSGAGGQHVNKTESAVRLTHIPTGVVVECQEERSQLKNYDKAMKVLRSKLYEAEVIKREQERAKDRKSQVSTGDRSAKIRTYNFPQGRLTDHRIGLTLYNLDNIISGDLEDVVQALKIADNLEKLQSGGNNE